MSCHYIYWECTNEPINYKKESASLRESILSQNLKIKRPFELVAVMVWSLHKVWNSHILIPVHLMVPPAGSHSPGKKLTEQNLEHRSDKWKTIRQSRKLSN